MHQLLILFAKFHNIIKKKALFIIFVNAVTFTIKAPAAQLVVITGASPYFPNWDPNGIAMTKGDDGVWSYTLTAKKSDEIAYKFLLDGAWLADPNAPTSIDDGYGGKNGVVPVAALVGDGTVAIKKGPIFSTWSMIGAEAAFDTTDKDGSDTGLLTSGLGVRSVWKVKGYAVDMIPWYLEIDVADNQGFNNWYERGKLENADGIKKTFTSLIFDPLTILHGDRDKDANDIFVGHFKTGLETKWLEWSIGYRYAKISPHTNVSWTTITDNWDAGWVTGGGFSQFTLGSALRQITDTITLNASLIPNKTADREGKRYGMIALANVQTPFGYFDVQYNGAYGTTFDAIFDEIPEADVILGYKGTFGPVTVKLNGLYSKFGCVKTDNGLNKKYYIPSSSDVGETNPEAPFLDGTAANVQVTYSADMFNVTLGYRHRGKQANMMYVKQDGDDTLISDQLGSPNNMKFWLDGSVTPMDMLTVGLNVGAEKVFDTEGLNDDAKALMKLNIEPKVSVKLTDVIGIDSSVDAYGKMYAFTNDSAEFLRGKAEGSAFVLGEAGLQYNMGAINDVVGGINVKYGFDNGNDDLSSDYLFNTLLAEVKLPLGFTAQAGFGLRTANGDADAPNAPFGAFLGAWKKLDTILQKPIVYAQCVYNMNPYSDFGDGQEIYNLDGYTLDKGVAEYEGKAAIRLAMRWDF